MGRWLLSAIVFGMALLPAACGGSAPADAPAPERAPQPQAAAEELAAIDRPTDTDETSAQRARWNDAGVSDYRLELFVSRPEVLDPEPCGARGEIVVIVEDSRPVEAFDRNSGCQIDLVTRPAPLTVEELFELAETAAADAEFPIRYDPELGYPLFAGEPLDGAYAQVIWLAPTDEPDPVRAERVRELEEASSRWARAAITSYRYTVSLRCQACVGKRGGPFTVTVREGVTTRVTFSGRKIEPDTFAPVFTVEELFGLVERHVLAEELAVDYHPERGYPLLAEVNPYLMTVDEEFGFTVESLEPA